MNQDTLKDVAKYNDDEKMKYKTKSSLKDKKMMNRQKDDAHFDMDR